MLSKLSLVFISGFITCFVDIRKNIEKQLYQPYLLRCNHFMNESLGKYILTEEIRSAAVFFSLSLAGLR